MSNENRGRREQNREDGSMGETFRQWRRQRRERIAGMTRGQRIRRRLLQAALVLSIIVIAVWVVLNAWIRVPEVPDPSNTNDPTSSNQNGGDLAFDGAELPSVTQSGRREGYYTFLVAGQDVVSGSTDTMLLFTFDTQNKTLNAISLLRDTMINTSARQGAQKRLNVVYARSRGPASMDEADRVEQGMTGLKQEVSKLTGIYPDFYVLVKWEAIGELVDALGGVYFEVPFDMDYDDPIQDLHIHQKAGYRKLTGEDAMEVIRFRKDNNGKIALGDVGRTAIQRDFLSSVLSQCLQPAVMLKVPALAQVFLDNVSTDLSVGNLLAFAQLAMGMDTENDVQFFSMPYTGVMYNRAALVLPVRSELLEILNSGLNPYLDDIQASDLQLMYRNRDGSYGVTNGKLADASMAVPPAPSEPAEPEEPENPDEPEDPAAGDPGGPGGDTPGTGEPADPGTEDPGDDPSAPDVPDPEDPAGEPETQPGAGDDPAASEGVPPLDDPAGMPFTQGEREDEAAMPPDWLLPDVA